MVKVAEDATEGTHNLELAIEGNSFDYNSKKNIPLKVDASNVKVITSKELTMVDGKATVEFDVANIHPNEFNSVSIKPEAEGVKFYPTEYFIGPMNPDELFTIDFNAVAENPAIISNDGINMGLIPADAAEIISQSISCVKSQRVDEIESEIRHASSSIIKYFPSLSSFTSTCCFIIILP